MVSLHGGYSKKYQQQAQESLAQLKEHNQDDDKGKIKVLSRQTNEIRRKLDRKKRSKEEKEEERRKSILENRRLKQQIATEKFQRATEPTRSKHVRSASAGTLKDGRYNVAGYIIDIQNGVRVNSALTKPANPIKRKARLSNHTSILNLPDSLAPLNNRTVLLADSNQNSEYNINNNVNNFNFNPKMYNLPVTNQKTISNNQMQPFKAHHSSSDSVCSSDSLNKISNDLKGSSATKVTFSEHTRGGCQSTLINNEASGDIAAYTTEQLLEQMQKNLSTINETTGEGSQSFNSMVALSPRVNKVAVVSPRVLNDEKIMGDNKDNIKYHTNSMIALSLKDSLDVVNSSLNIGQDAFKRNTENKYSSFITGSATIKTLNQQVFHKQPYPEKIESSKSLSTSASSFTSYLNSSENVKPTYLSSSSNHVTTTYSKEINSSIASSSQSSKYSSVISNIKFSSKPSSVSNICGNVVYPTTNAGVQFFDANQLRVKMENQSAEPNKHFASDINMENEKKFLPFHFSQYNQPVNHSSGNPNILDKSEKNNMETITDKVYRQAQQDFAGLTFEKMKLKADKNFLNNFNKDSKVNDHLEVNSNFSCKNVDAGFDEYINHPALTLQSNSNTGRQARLIVSADSKKRLKTDFTPHPPLKPKSAKDSRQDFQNNSNPIVRFDSNDTLNTTQFSRLNSYNLASVNNSSVKHVRSFSSTDQQTFAPTENIELAQKLHVTFLKDLKNNFDSSLPYQTTGKCLETQQSKKKGFPVALNKTPTDDEINNLWENVRQCLSAESSGRQAHSDIVAVTQISNQSPRNSNHGQIYRSFSASSYRRYNSLENSVPKKQHSAFYQSKNTNASVSNRQTLLPQRALRMIKNPKITSKLDLNHNDADWAQRNHALSSTASFLALEELCAHESLSPKQTDVFFHPSVQFKKKTNNVDLSFEERRVMASLDRINKELQEKERQIVLRKPR